MSEPQMSSQDAYRVEQSILGNLGAARSRWPHLAVSLFAFHQGKGWKCLGYETFGEWIAQPGISMGRSTAYAYIDIYETICIEREWPIDVLAGLEPSKIMAVLPAIKEGRVEADAALADALGLSKSDLRAKYSVSEQSEEEPVRCPTCGRPYKGKG